MKLGSLTAFVIILNVIAYVMLFSSNSGGEYSSDDGDDTNVPKQLYYDGPDKYLQELQRAFKNETNIFESDTSDNIEGEGQCDYKPRGALSWVKKDRTFVKTAPFELLVDRFALGMLLGCMDDRFPQGDNFDCRMPASSVCNEAKWEEINYAPAARFSPYYGYQVKCDPLTSKITYVNMCTSYNKDCRNGYDWDACAINNPGCTSTFPRCYCGDNPHGSIPTEIGLLTSLTHLQLR